MSQKELKTTKEQGEYLTILLDVANIIQRTQINVKKCPKQRLTEGYIRTRLKTIEDYWNTFKDAHNNLTRCTPQEQKGVLPYFLNEEFYTVEDLYLCLHADLSDHLLKLKAQNVAMDVSNASTSSDKHQENLTFVNLPRIQLPTFSGKYEDWPTYQDLFTALVHNTNLSNVQKLHYLKTSVSGEAEMLLRHIQILENNYTQAWDLLKGRFGNKKMIVNSLMKKLFGQRKVTTQSSTNIKNLLDVTTECINSLKNLNINTETWDPVIIFLVAQKLDADSLKDWEEFSQKEKGDDLPTWDILKTFLENKFRTLELVTPATSNLRERSQTHKSFYVTAEQDKIASQPYTSRSSQPSCSYCNGGHYIFQCKEFGKQSVEQRQMYVKNNRLCYNCLIPNHNVYQCKQKTSCRVCGRKHHSLLHLIREQNEKNVSQLQSQPEPNITTAHFSNQQPGHQVLLATAQVRVMSNDGSTHIFRALIDQGSEASFVSARASELLGLTRTDINGVVSGVGEGNTTPLRHVVDLKIMTRFNKNNLIPVRAYILKNISTKLPSKYIQIKPTELQTLELADPTYYKPGKVDMLLGSDIFCQIIEDGLVKMSEGVVAQKTSLGWILSGQIEEKENCRTTHNIITLHVTRITEDNDILRRFWEIETESYTKKKLFTKEEEKCEEIYKATTKRNSDGRYIVHLPLKQSIEETVRSCGETKQQAISRFKYLEKKFEKSEKLKIEYHKVINEYKALGHMRKLETTKNDDNSIYLPHHAVIREDRITTKVRVVFDASARGSNNQSLNDTMMVGPVLQPDLRSLILSWRKHRICVVGDIVKMYRMILMTEEHTNLQRIIWRDDPSEEFESYNLTTVTFGTAAAPFLAVRTLNQLADDEAHDFPETAPVIKESFYMDDLMIGNDNIESIKKMCHEIKTILQKGGFEMQKWSSNSEEVLKYLQNDNCTRDTVEIRFDKTIKILGLTWDRKEDDFKISVNLPEMRHPITKRSVLSDIARLFDPFGWLSPVVITAKIMIQKLWLCNLGWDDELPSNLCEEWKTYRDELMHLQNIRIPRWLNITPENKNNIQLHGFADASTQAYAAVTYLRIVENGEVHVMMVSSRSKVAPLKQLSIPKLELCAALLLAELINDLAEVLKIPKDNTFAWTDSTVVLSWLQSQPSRWKTFVANRVAEISRTIENKRWKHVRSAENPADLATRGINTTELATSETWWSGPTWLKQKIIDYDNSEIPETKLEEKISCNLILEEEQPIWERFSTILKMKRVLAYCRRMLKPDNNEQRKTYLEPKEMERVLEECIKYYQNLVFYKDIEELKKDGRVRKGSTLITLTPFLDNKGLLRVGGRLQNASIPESSKHPLIIPSNKHITRLLIDEAHLKTLHGGIQIMMAYLRTNYWIIGLKSSVKKCIHNCKICIVDKAKSRFQLMGQLPAVRVNEHRAFINSGVDFAGPILMRTSKGRGHHAIKGYICLFVCMSTRAIHLETVTDLTSQAFIAAFRRFVARRGRCLHIWSDNGTNFVGAARELQELFQREKRSMIAEIAEIIANDGTTWHFIPPKMPTCGGLWEAGVQSAKRHLMRINKDTRLTYEEMSTLLAEIEACLNSRPLCQIDNTTDTPLTPGHFLVGEPLVGVPDLSYEHKNINLLTRWQLIQRLTQDFWNKWRTEYLHTLQQRHKWQHSVSSPAIGDLVIIKDEILPPTKWLLGRIKRVHPGPDNLVRVVTIQCKGDHEMKRPLSKLILLPTLTLSHGGRLCV